MEIDSHSDRDALTPDTTRLIARAAAVGASDLHLAPGRPAIVRIDGGLQTLDAHVWHAADLERACRALLTAEQRDQLDARGAVDLALAATGAPRVRAHLLRCGQAPALCFRLLPTTLPEFSALGLPSASEGWPDLDSGLLLITGATGSGKSTTLAALVQRILRQRPVHVLTIEDPVEYVHRSDLGLVTQRALGGDVPSFAEALRQALRQDPDVILVGEMRDPETIRGALLAAETGHLVLATLHSPTTTLAVRRILDCFESGEQSAVRAQLAEVLQAIVAQTLLPGRAGGRLLAAELLVATNGVRALIRDGKTHQLGSQLEAGQSESGMQTMAQAIARLNAAGMLRAAGAPAVGHGPRAGGRG